VNEKGYGRRYLWPTLRYYLSTCLEELRKTMKTLRVAYVTAETVSWVTARNKSEALLLETACSFAETNKACRCICRWNG
jgi:hypothetical protein